MEKPTWNKTLGDVLHEKTQEAKLLSASGNEYVTDVIPSYDVVVLGSATAKTDSSENITGYVYEIYDPKHDLGGFTITAPNLIRFKGMKKVRFSRVRGGALNNKSEGWFKADRIDELK
ncbi:hypothetical protein [Lactobacillus gallinarum]|uniref:Uncharacterized protein n=1 Tax=Lactobacillus gallinarum TaxID=52242 RepID=A0A1Y4VWE1_9LACO|nr:hypothetical protein [Lactobacillus gallinarum]OUQ74437.1 hypothetical protein B5E44_09750 [Lactobacillus gallinarum]